jgi:hypothetical protein
MYTTTMTASPQKYPNNCFDLSMHCTIPAMLWLRCSTTPFCCGEYGAVSYRTTPCSVQCWLNSTEVNTPLPRSMHRVFNFFPVSASTKIWKSLIMDDALSLLGSRRIHINHERSSTNNKKYLLPLEVPGVTELQRSLWIRSRKGSTRRRTCAGNGVHRCLPTRQPSHT